MLLTSVYVWLWLTSLRSLEQRGVQPEAALLMGYPSCLVAAVKTPGHNGWTVLAHSVVSAGGCTRVQVTVQLVAVAAMYFGNILKNFLFE